jgi:hypothetical protein
MQLNTRPLDFATCFEAFELKPTCAHQALYCEHISKTVNFKYQFRFAEKAPEMLRI